jgi:hypothetical protein
MSPPPTTFDAFLFGRFYLEMPSSLSQQEAFSRLQGCVQPYVWPMFFPREALYGTVNADRISFSRIGGGNRFGSMYEFVGRFVPGSNGVSLVGEVHAKGYWVAYMLFALLLFIGVFVLILSMGLSGAQGGPPPFVIWFFPLWLVFVFSLVFLEMRRSAEGFARYVDLVVGNAFAAK